MDMPITPLRRSDIDSERRIFLKVGAAGTALLLLARWLPQANAAAATRERKTSLAHLGAADMIVLGRIIPVMLEGALPANEVARKSAIDEITAGVDLVIDHQPANVRAEIRDLFALLNRSVTRALVAGIWTSWDKASDEDVREFLTGWRNSRFALLRSAYIGLNNLIMGSWYGNPKSWERIGYAGPPKIA